MTSRKHKSSFGRDSLQSRNSVTGASASKLPRSTPLLHSSKKVLASQSKSVSKRSSYFAGGDHHVMKDTRPLADKGYIRKCVNELITFLSEMNYPHPLSVKLMSPPTNKEYFRIVEFVYGLLSPNYKMMVRPEEETSKILMDLNYPFNISKSTLNNIGAMSAWPNALGALDWLVDLVKYKKSVEQNELKEILYSGDRKQEAFHGYLQATYTAFMHGDNAPFTEIDDALSEQLAEMNKNVLAEVEEMKTKMQKHNEEKERLLSEKAEISNLEQEVLRHQKMKKNLEEYFEQLDKYCCSVEEQCKARESKLHEMQQLATQLEQANKEIQSTITGQELSVADVQNMKIEINQKENAIKAMESRCKQLQEQYFEKQIEQSKLIDEVNSQIIEYTSACTELELIPAGALKADGTDYSLSTDRAQLDNNVEKLLTIIRPKLIAMKSALLKDLGKLQQERNHNATVIEQLKEEVADKKRAKESLQQQLDKLKDEEDQKRAEFEKVEDRERNDVHAIKEDIQRLKTINSLSVEEVSAQVKAERERLKEIENANLKERDELFESLARVCKSCLAYKDKIQTLISAFNNNIEETTRKYLPQIREYHRGLEEAKSKLDSLEVEIEETAPESGQTQSRNP